MTAFGQERALAGLMKEYNLKHSWAIRDTAFRDFVAGAEFSSVRLVHYVGAGEPNGKDVSPPDVQAEVACCLQEGFYVDWTVKGEQLFILIQEPDGPVPPWDKAFAEEALVDVEALLREARERGELADD